MKNDNSDYELASEITPRDPGLGYIIFFDSEESAWVPDIWLGTLENTYSSPGNISSF